MGSKQGGILGEGESARFEKGRKERAGVKRGGGGEENSRRPAPVWAEYGQKGGEVTGSRGINF